MTYQTLVSQIHKTSHVLVLVVPLYFFIIKKKKSYNLQTLKWVHTKATIKKVVERHNTPVKKPQLTNTKVKLHSSLKKKNSEGRG